MKTEKAEALYTLLSEASELLNNYRNTTEPNLVGFDFKKDKFSKELFINSYNDFLLELADNARQYNDFTLVKDYLSAIFSFFLTMGRGFQVGNQAIIMRKVEIEYLITLKKWTDDNCIKIKSFLNPDTSQLYNFYMEATKDPESETQPEKKKNIQPVYELNPKFVYNNLKAELETISTIGDKIKLVNARLCEFLQWDLDTSGDFSIISEADTHYPKFEQKCQLEIKRLETEFEIDRKIRDAETPLTRILNETPFSDYSWATQNIDLLELVTSLHLCGAIVRRDGKDLTRKELVESFAKLFQTEIKDAESKLAKATARKTTPTPFLDRLQKAFITYCHGKDSK